MSMDHPPSYLDATRRQDWLELVAPYVSLLDYPGLCLVDTRFYRQFAPRLWNDPLRAARTLGLVQQYDYEWYFRFILRHLRAVRTSTRALVTTLDLRGFALDVPRVSVEFGDVDVNQTLRVLPPTFPWLRYILLDGHRDVDAGLLANPIDPAAFRAAGFEPPLLLSIPSCQIKLSSSFFASPYLKRLVYLDISHVRGSIQSPILHGKISPQNFPHLRILKVRGRGLDLDDTTTYVLLNSFATQLWSLDLSGNRITDGLLPELVNLNFPPLPIRSGVARFDVEGILSFESSGHNSYGKHAFIQESHWSGSFSHPQRYLADAPVYTLNFIQEAPQRHTGLRSDGRERIRDDSADGVKKLLSDGLDTVPIEHVYDLDVCGRRQGITHIYLNNTDVSARGLGRLIRESPGQLERLECCSPLITIPAKSPSESALPDWLGKRPRLYGAVGIAHLFRPVWSSNLQVLRIHHSLVTQVLTLARTSLPAMENIWLAETYLLPRAMLAHPQAFVPDMNPRLRSLTLTQIPRYSVGPLIEKLIGLLKLASVQEREIQDAARKEGSSTTARHGPSILLGLRHIHFQFEPAPRSQHSDHGVQGDGDINIDAQDFGLSSDDFSFFASDSGGGGWGVSSSSGVTSFPSTRKTSSSTQQFDQQQRVSVSNNIKTHSSPSLSPRQRHPTTAHHQPPSARLPPATTTARLTTYPYSETTDAYLPHVCTWNDVEYILPVWIGDGHLSPSQPPALAGYMQNLGHPALLTRIEPASSGHVVAGVPAGAFIFSDAWDAMLVPPLSSSSWTRGVGDPGLQRPSGEQLDEMRDVLGAVKEWRAQSRRQFQEQKERMKTNRGDGDEAQVPLGEPHFYYTGKVEISIEDTVSLAGGGGGGGSERGK